MRWPGGPRMDLDQPTPGTGAAELLEIDGWALFTGVVRLPHVRAEAVANWQRDGCVPRSGAREISGTATVRGIAVRNACRAATAPMITGLEITRRGETRAPIASGAAPPRGRHLYRHTSTARTAVLPIDYYDT